MCNGRDRVLPDQFFCWYFRAEIAGTWSHVAVRQLVPCTRKCIRKLDPDFRRNVLRFFHRSDQLSTKGPSSASLARDALTCRAHRVLYRHQRHSLASIDMHRQDFLPAPIRSRIRFSKKLLLHFVGVVVHAPSSPLVIVCTPCPLPNVFFHPRLCSSMLAAAGSVTYIFACIGRAVRFAKGVTSCNECHGFLIIHCHATKSLADVTRCRNRIRFSVRTFRIYIDQSHLNRTKGIFEFADHPNSDLSPNHSFQNPSIFLPVVPIHLHVRQQNRMF